MKIIANRSTLFDFINDFFNHKITTDSFLDKILEILIVIRMDLEELNKTQVINIKDYSVLKLFLDLCLHYRLDRSKIGKEINNTFFELIHSNIEESSNDDLHQVIINLIFEPLENQLSLYFTNLGFKIEPFPKFFTLILSGILYIIRGRQLEFNCQREVKGKMIKLIESSFKLLNNSNSYAFHLSFDCLTPLTEEEQKGQGWFHMKGLFIELKGYKNYRFVF